MKQNNTFKVKDYLIKEFSKYARVMNPVYDYVEKTSKDLSEYMIEELYTNFSLDEIKTYFRVKNKIDSLKLTVNNYFDITGKGD